MFLLYINDINCGISSKLQLFADDCILYRTINGQNDHFHLQTDLDLIVKWTETWQMNLNIDKCAILTCSRLLSSSTSVYTINGQSLTRVTQHPYLGVMFDSTMSFSPHISNITCKAMRTLNFVKRNLYKCNRDTKCMAYTSLVRPVLEYASSVWDPHLNKKDLAIEMVQRQAARWVESDYLWTSSVTSMLCDLNWSTLQRRREISRLKTFYNVIYNTSALKIPHYFVITTYATRHQHPLHFITPSVRTNSYKYSYFPRTVRNWNNLPIQTIESSSLQLFLANLTN